MNINDRYRQSILPHGPLVHISPRLWSVTGTLPRGPMTRNMIIHRLGDGSLLIHSAVAVSQETLQQIVALGEPRYIIAPCRLHRLDCASFQEVFPRSEILAPAAARKSVEEVARVAGTCEELLPAAGVKVHRPSGVKPYEVVLQVDGGDGPALIFNDILMNLPHLPGFSGWVLKAIGSTGFFGMTGIGRYFLLDRKNNGRAKFKSFLQDLSDIQGLSHVCLSHGLPVSGEAAIRQLRQASERL